MPDVVLDKRTSIGVIALSDGVNVSKVRDGRNRTVWDLSPERARALATHLMAEASGLDGLPVPVTTTWLAMINLRDEDQPVFDSAPTEAAAKAIVAAWCRDRKDGLPEDDEEAIDAFFERADGTWAVTEETVGLPAIPRPATMPGRPVPLAA